MAARILTKRGDILILKTTRSYTIHAVGRVSRAGQRDFIGEADVKHERDYAAAVAEAKAMAMPGQRIFIRDIDTDDWSEILA